MLSHSSNLLAMASALVAMASNLVAMEVRMHTVIQAHTAGAC